MALTEAQKRAQQKYNEKNRDKQRIQGYRRTAKMFINTHATLDDLNELQTIINDRMNQLKK